MEEYQALLDEIFRLQGEDRTNIRKCLQGDLLRAYEKYMKEEQALLNRIRDDFNVLIQM